jgi:hypothetical protein
VRVALAIAALVLVLTAAVAPHVHEGPLGDHACLACVAAGAEEATGQTPDVAPRPLEPVDVVQVQPAAPVFGVPLGAIPGQSPPGV